MKMSRNTTSRIRYVLDELLPPAIRDSKFFMTLPFKILYKNKADIFMNFKQSATNLTKEDFANVYKKISEMDSRVSDLNTACEKKILKSLAGNSILEVGCGKADLASKIPKKYHITATDIVIEKIVIKNHPNIRFKEANVENLPFKEKGFDTVICAHTLEHVQNISKAIKELRRVTKKRLIIVVPKQRPYRYTFDLHIHFFPYEQILLTAFKTDKKLNIELETLDGDWFYIENY